MYFDDGWDWIAVVLQPLLFSRRPRKMKYLLVAILLCSFVAASFATLGVDVSLSTSKSAWQCLKGKGYTFAVVRGYRSSGSVDSAAATNVANAWSAGFKHVDVYVFPCPRCAKSASQQVRETVQNLRNSGTRYGMLWLDIEAVQYWKDVAYNRAWLTEAINEALSLGQNVGIYTSSYQWSTIMGSWSGAARYPLWYAHYDNNPSFSDFRPFGGWSRPAIKQYVGDASECGVGIDKNWYP